MHPTVQVSIGIFKVVDLLPNLFSFHVDSMRPFASTSLDWVVIVVMLRVNSAFKSQIYRVQ